MQKCVGSFFVPFYALDSSIKNFTFTYLVTSFRVLKKVCIFALTKKLYVSMEFVIA